MSQVAPAAPPQPAPAPAVVVSLAGVHRSFGDNPALAGFDRPILHGLCTYGFTGRALLHTLCGSDPARFRSMEGRFSSPVFPGETVTIEAWDTGDGEAIFQTCGDDGRVVLDAGRITFTA